MHTSGEVCITIIRLYTISCNPYESSVVAQRILVRIRFSNIYHYISSHHYYCVKNSSNRASDQDAMIISQYVLCIRQLDSIYNIASSILDMCYASANTTRQLSLDDQGESRGEGSSRMDW